MLKLWDVATWREARTLQLNGSVAAQAIRISLGGRHVFFGERNNIRQLDIETGREVRTFRGHKDEVRAIALALDGRIFASGGHDGTLKIWDVATGRVLKTIVHDRGISV